MRVIISGTGIYNPPQSIDNEELVKSFNEFVKKFNIDNEKEISEGSIDELTLSTEAFIKKVSGIEKRYVMDKEGILNPERMMPSLKERTNDEPSLQAEIAVKASEEALKQSNKEPKDIDAVICACANLQRAYPAIAIEIQNLLGIEGYAYDMNVACSSSTFAYQNAVTDIKSGLAKNILIVNPEICSGHLNFKDKDGHFIFGDVCAASIIESNDDVHLESRGYEIISTKLSTVFSNNIRNNFGFLNKAENSDPFSHDKLFIQKGRSVFKEVVPLVCSEIKGHLDQFNISIKDIKRFWFHQANLNMNLLIAKKLLGREAYDHEMPIILDEYANTSSAGSIIAFHKFKDDLEEGDMGIICSFGAGYSIGSVIVKKI